MLGVKEEEEEEENEEVKFVFRNHEPVLVLLLLLLYSALETCSTDRTPTMLVAPTPNSRRLLSIRNIFFPKAGYCWMLFRRAGCCRLSL